MLKFMFNVFQIVCGILIAEMIILLFIVCLLTPEKTKDGTYTNVYKYWTDDTYLCRNFNCNNQPKGNHND